MEVMSRRVLRTVLVAALMLTFPVVAAAQEAPEDEILPCEGDVVAGTVVDVDETGMVTVETAAGECTVMLDGEYEHPTYGLIGSYFGDVSAGELGEALDALSGWAVQDEDGEWSWAEEGDEGAAMVLSVVDNEDGTYSIELAVDGQDEAVLLTTEDAEWADALAAALETLVVDWRLEVDDEGDVNVVDVADDVGGYHEDGMGFGSLVKVYAIAAESAEACADEEGPCGATVEQLVLALQSGTGMGQLFEEYGKPSVLGVGHLREKDEEGAAIQEAYRADIEACRNEFREARESLRAERKALQGQLRELAHSDAEDAEEQRAQLQAELEAIEEEIEALEAANEACLGDAELAKEEAMAGVDLDDEEGGHGKGKQPKGKKDKNKGKGLPDNAQGWGAGGNPEGSDDE